MANSSGMANNSWRMAFKWGSQGKSYWRDLRGLGIAAIGYEGLNLDLSQKNRDQHDDIWRSVWPKNTSGRSSLRNFAYEMKIGDTIYAKEGNSIAGRGIVISDYIYDPRKLRSLVGWEHYRRVEWEDNFEPLSITLGAELTTVLCLDPLRRERLAVAAAEASVLRRELDDYGLREGTEGRAVMRLHLAVERNRELAQAKKESVLRMAGRLRCEACGFDFAKLYGQLGRGYIECHHTIPFSKLRGLRRTRLSDLALVCSNCHRMLHRRDGLRIAGLRDLLEQRIASDT